MSSSRNTDERTLFSKICRLRRLFLKAKWFVNICAYRLQQGFNIPHCILCVIYVSAFMISLEANSNNNDVLASFKAPRLALLKDAAVPVGDLGSINTQQL